MNRKIKYIHVAILSLACVAWLDPFRDEVSRGNSEFHRQKYDRAREHYRKAGKHAPSEKERMKLSFNRGDADYMSGDLNSAIAGYQRAVQSEDRDVQKKAFFNMGNAYLKMERYDEAVQSYINALKIDPGYERAKKNIEYILKNRKDDKKDRKNDSGDKGQKKKSDDKKDKQQERDRNRDSGSGKEREKNRPSGKMSREQIRNILESMKQKPVRRKKGSANERIDIEKYW